MVKVKVIHTTKGEYGKAKRGQEIKMRGSVAKTLAQRGTVEILTDDDEEEWKPEKISGGVRVKVNSTANSLMDNKIILKDDRESVTGVKETEKAEEKKKFDEKAEQGKKQVTHTEKKEYK